jgi:hypothetical protein
LFTFSGRRGQGGFKKNMRRQGGPLPLAVRFNQWIQDHGLPTEYTLVHEADLIAVLGLSGRPSTSGTKLKFPAPTTRTIRQFFKVVGGA